MFLKRYSVQRLEMGLNRRETLKISMKHQLLRHLQHIQPRSSKKSVVKMFSLLCFHRNNRSVAQKQLPAESNNNSLGRDAGPAGECRTRAVILTLTSTCGISQDYTHTHGDRDQLAASVAFSNSSGKVGSCECRLPSDAVQIRSPAPINNQGESCQSGVRHKGPGSCSWP